MSTAFDKLRRILVLEREQSCRDRAVIGGLERFLTFWQKEAREQADQVSAELSVDEILARLAGYAGQTPEQRRPLVEELVISLARVRTLEQPAAAMPSPQAPVMPQPAAMLSPERTLRTEPPMATPATVSAPASETPTSAQPEPTPKAALPHGPQPRGEQAARAVKPRARATANPLDLNASVTTLKGLGPAGERRLAPLGIATVRDLIYHFPRRYDDYSQLAHINQLALGQMVTVAGIVVRTHAGSTRNKAPIFYGRAARRHRAD